MRSIKAVLGSACVAALVSCTGCVAVSVASMAVSGAGTAVNVGISGGSAVVGVAGTVAKGAVNAGGTVIDKAMD